MAWKPLRLGAGGYQMGIDIALDGTMVTHGDTPTGTAILHPNSSEWVNLFNAENWDGYVQGCWEIRIAPNNSQRIYAQVYSYVGGQASGGFVWRTDDRG